MKKMKRQNTGFLLTFTFLLCTLCALVPLWLKFNQSKITNYAKQTQFIKKSNVYKISFDKELQRKMDDGHLVKTNPNKPNFIRHNLGEGGFKGHAIKREPIGRRDAVVAGGPARQKPPAE
jgi:hypothetical protein